MPYSYNVVTISGNEYPSYSDIATADAYLIADVTADSWNALTSPADDDTKGKLLVTATRFLDRQVWSGEKTDPDQELAWPRKNVAGVDEDEIPDAIVQATCLLAVALLNGFDVNANPQAGGGTKRLKADTVEIEYWFSNPDLILPMPLSIWQLISPYMGAGTDGLLFVGGSESFGTCGVYPFARGWDFNRGI